MICVWAIAGLVEPHLPDASQPLNLVALCQSLAMTVLLFGWCKSHAQVRSVKPPAAAPLLTALVAPIGLPYYAFKTYGFVENQSCFSPQ
jgi:hypothetical protein